MQYVVRTTSGEIRNTRSMLKGMNVTSTAGATINVRDGGASGTIVVSAIIAATGTFTEQFGDLPFNTDVYFEVASGSVTHGAFFVE